MARARPEQPRRPATREGLLLWVMHRFAEALGEHAVLKGGMALRLLDSPRQTNDLDYVFVPYESKKDISRLVQELLAELEGASVEVGVHSTMVRCEVRLDKAAIQVEISASASCRSVPAATAPLASSLGVPSRVVRIMEPGVALSHKLAAWNERRLMRDLYDAYFLMIRAGAKLDVPTLKARLAKVHSRIPRLRRRTRMSIGEFAADLNDVVGELTDRALSDELGGAIDGSDLPGLALRIQAALRRLTEELNGLPP